MSNKALNALKSHDENGIFVVLRSLVGPGVVKRNIEVNYDSLGILQQCNSTLKKQEYYSTSPQRNKRSN